MGRIFCKNNFPVAASVADHAEDVNQHESPCSRRRIKTPVRLVEFRAQIGDGIVPDSHNGCHSDCHLSKDIRTGLPVPLEVEEGAHPDAENLSQNIESVYIRREIEIEHKQRHRSEDDELVADRIKITADNGFLVQNAGQEAVEKIGEGGQSGKTDKNAEPEKSRLAQVFEGGIDKRRQKQDAQNGEKVRHVHKGLVKGLLPIHDRLGLCRRFAGQGKWKCGERARDRGKDSDDFLVRYLSSGKNIKRMILSGVGSTT